MRSIRNILVVQPYGIGDALFMTPLLRALRTLPTVETVDLALGSRTEPAFRHNPHVGRIYSMDKGKWQSASKRKVFKEIFSLWKEWRGRYDLLVDLSLQREYGFYAASFLGIPRRIGFNFKGRGCFLTHSVPLPQGFEGTHAIDFYCELGKFLGLEIEDRYPEFYLSEEDRQEAEGILMRNSHGNPYVTLAPGGGESWGKDAHFKRWPAQYFSDFILRLRERMNFKTVVVLGSDSEKELGEEIENYGSRGGPCLRSDTSLRGTAPLCARPTQGAREGRPYNVINLCGQLSLGASAAILEKASLFLANDGGLVHCAHALQVPLIAFYGPVDPKVYGPYPASSRAISLFKKALPCRPCYSGFRYNSACADQECLTALEPKEVLEFLDKKKFWINIGKERKTEPSLRGNDAP